MRDQLDAAIGGLALGFIAFLVLAGPITLVLVGLMLPLLMPLVLACLIAGGILTALIDTIRNWLGRP